MNELPTKWLLEITEENKALVNDWRVNIMKYSSRECPNTYISESGAGDVGDYAPQISWEQFQQHILKIKPIKIKKENYSYLTKLLKRLNIK